MRTLLGRNNVCLAITERVPGLEKSQGAGQKVPSENRVEVAPNVGHCWRGEAVTRDRRLGRRFIRSLCVQADPWVKTPGSPQGMSLKFCGQPSQMPLMLAERTAMKIPFQLCQSPRGAPSAPQSHLELPPELFIDIGTDSHACSSVCRLERDGCVPGHSHITQLVLGMQRERLGSQSDGREFPQMRFGQTPCCGLGQTGR